MAPFAVLPVWPGLLLLSFSSCERERPWLASLFLVLGTMAWALVLAALPILFVSPAELAWQYGNWWVLHTTSTHAAGAGVSAARILHSWFHVDPPRVVLLAIAGAIAALPFVIAMAGIGLWSFYQERTRLHLALLWMALLLVSVSYSDLVSHAFRERFIRPYAIKALPVVVIWAVAVVELTLRREPGRRPGSV